MTTPGLKTGRPEPLTDTQLRATAVEVTGTLTDAELRASPVPVELDESTTNEANSDIRDLLCQILGELKKMNVHLSIVTGEELSEEEWK